jgi:hypothetical protein
MPAAAAHLQLRRSNDCARRPGTADSASPSSPDTPVVTPPELSGGCLCGAIRYHIAGAPLFVGQCYCKDCQKATGTGHSTVVGVLETQLSVEGTPAVHASVGGSGRRVRRHFCPACAGRLYTAADSAGPVHMVQAGSLDEPNAVTPTVAIFVKDALNWDRIDPTMTKFDHVPPNPPTT